MLKEKLTDPDFNKYLISERENAEEVCENGRGGERRIEKKRGSREGTREKEGG
jgi:hypothetical protein